MTRVSYYNRMQAPQCITTFVCRAVLSAVLIGTCLTIVVADSLADDTGKQKSGSSESIEFARDILPIFKRSCYSCHSGPNPDGGYRLDHRQTAFSGGDSGIQAITSHQPDKSLLFLRVTSSDLDARMPPEGADVQPLSSEDIQMLRQWISSGPTWPDELAGEDGQIDTWWSLKPLARPTIPSSPQPETNPIDSFVGSRLAADGLRFSPKADRRTLLRRISYTLTGLPPTAQQTDAFTSDSNDKALDNVIDELLQSPRYGEHWARHWLDIANYADTHGNDHDYIRPNAWPYRDYVIQSLNSDKPYRQFIQEQIAGDTLFPDDPQATVALGFLAAGPWDETLMVGIREDTVDHLMAQNLDRDVMVTTVMSTFQSLTVHCARCHNHKFDPISQREYYSLQAVFAGIDRADRPYDQDPDVHTERKRLLARKTAIESRDSNVLAELTLPRTQTRLNRIEQSRRDRSDFWKPISIISATTVSGTDTIFSKQADDSWLVSGDAPEKDTYILTTQLK